MRKKSLTLLEVLVCLVLLVSVASLGLGHMGQFLSQKGWESEGKALVYWLNRLCLVAAIEHRVLEVRFVQKEDKIILACLELKIFKKFRDLKFISPSPRIDFFPETVSETSLKFEYKGALHKIGYDKTQNLWFLES